jgi:hypothetical protein
MRIKLSISMFFFCFLFAFQKDANFMKHHFGRTIIHVLPLLSIASLPHEVVSNEETQKARYDIIQKFISDRPELNVVQNVHHLAYMPFDIKEIMS